MRLLVPPDKISDFSKETLVANLEFKVATKLPI